MVNMQIDIDKLLEATIDLTSDNEIFKLKHIEIDQLLEKTRDRYKAKSKSTLSKKYS